MTPVPARPPIPSGGRAELCPQLGALPILKDVTNYQPEAITRDQADALPGRTVLQFGTDWCGYCRAAEPGIRTALADVEGVTRILVEDGKGRPLGRSYRVKLWPTLICLVDGVEVARVVRPWGAGALAPAMEALQAGPASSGTDR